MKSKQKKPKPKKEKRQRATGEEKELLLGLAISMIALNKPSIVIIEKLMEQGKFKERQAKRYIREAKFLIQALGNKPTPEALGILMKRIDLAIQFTWAQQDMKMYTDLLKVQLNYESLRMKSMPGGLSHVQSPAETLAPSSELAELLKETASKG